MSSKKSGYINIFDVENEGLMKEIAEKTDAKNTNETSDMRLVFSFLP